MEATGAKVLQFQTKEDKIFTKAKGLVGSEVLIRFSGVFGQYTLLDTIEENRQRGVRVVLHGFHGWLPLDGLESIEKIK
jgi:hypothetical protein